jgi:hypothetical protein
MEIRSAAARGMLRHTFFCHGSGGGKSFGLIYIAAGFIIFSLYLCDVGVKRRRRI